MSDVRRNGYQVTATISALTDKEAEAIRQQLLRWFAIPRVFSRDGDTVGFDATNAGSNGLMLAARVDAFFTGFLLAREGL